MLLIGVEYEIEPPQTIFNDIGELTGVAYSDRELRATLRLRCYSEEEIALVRALKPGTDYKPVLDQLVEHYLETIPKPDLIRKLSEAVAKRLDGK